MSAAVVPLRNVAALDTRHDTQCDCNPDQYWLKRFVSHDLGQGSAKAYQEHQTFNPRRKPIILVNDGKCEKEWIEKPIDQSRVKGEKDKTGNR